MNRLKKLKAASIFHKLMLLFWAGMMILTTPIACAMVYRFSIGDTCSWPFVAIGLFSPLALCGIWRKVMGA